MNSEDNALSPRKKLIEFSEEEYLIIEALAGGGYTIRMIAMYFNVDPDLLEVQCELADSTFKYHFDRGFLMKEADRDIKLSVSADGGSIFAIAQLEKNIKERRLREFKRRLLYGI